MKTTTEKIELLHKLNIEYWGRLGTLFTTDQYKYFYDTGTGKVFQCNLAEYSVIDCLLTHSSPELLYDLPLSVDELEGAIDNLIMLIEQEHIFQAPVFTDFIQPQKDEFPTIIESGIEQVILELTEKCNLRCKYCIYHEQNDQFRNFSMNDMSWDVAQKALDYISHHVGEELALTFYGGEPLINFKLMRKCIEYSQAIMSSTRISVSFTTNLTLLSDEIIDFLTSLDKCSILCSLDGPQHIQDFYRVTVDGRGSYDKAIEKMKKLAQAFAGKEEHSIGINAVLCPPYSLHKINEVADFFNTLEWLPEGTKVNINYVEEGSLDLQTLGLDKIELTPEEFYGHDVIADPLAVWANDRIDQDDDPVGIANEVGQTRLMRIHNRVITDTPQRGIHMNGCCFPGQRRLYVTTSGEYRVCEKMSTSPGIGDIERGLDIEAISKHYFADYSKKSIENCSNCWAARLCGVCYAMCYQEDGLNEDRKQDICHSERATAKIYLRRYHQLLENNPEKLQCLNEITIS
ncbi:radical SAM protein [Paenibacillus sp. FSL K6-1230]|uniref:radical SAM protein n=1 Tax=Paenibacillus sp. FSL K6-1230 TaxID=2921603 RepID=UPI0030F8AF92